MPTCYIGVGNTPKKVKSIYIGVNDKAAKVKKGWIGVNGQPKLFYTAEGLNQVYEHQDTNRLGTYGIDPELIGTWNDNYIIFASIDFDYYRYYFIKANDLTFTTTVPTTWKFACAAGLGTANNAYICGGYNNTSYTSQAACVRIDKNLTYHYDNLSSYGVKARYNEPRTGSCTATIGNKYGIYAGGRLDQDENDSDATNSLDYVNISTGTWSHATMFYKRLGQGMCGTTGSVVIAGGEPSSGGSGDFYLNSVERIDSNLSQTSLAALSTRTNSIVGATAGDMCIFAGGETYNGNSWQNAAKAVTYYRPESGTRGLLTNLPVGLTDMNGIGCNGYAIFAGGYYYDSQSDIYGYSNAVVYNSNGTQISSSNPDYTFETSIRCAMASIYSSDTLFYFDGVTRGYFYGFTVG